MNRSVRVVGALALLLAALPFCASAEDLFASPSLEAACRAARSSKRLVVIDFYTSPCPPCELLDRTTLADTKVRAWLMKTFVCCKIDADDQTSLAERYEVETSPTILLLRPDGKEIDRLVGYRAPKKFLFEARQALAGNGSLARARARLTGAGATDPMRRMDYALTLAERRLDAEALKEFLWCLDRGNQYDRRFQQIRRSALMSDIVEITLRYPPALGALTRRRDIARAALGRGVSDPGVLADFVAYNRSLDEEEQTLATYDELKGRYPSVAHALFESVIAQLIHNKRYAEVIARCGDVSVAIARAISRYGEMLRGAGAGTQDRKSLKRATAERCAGYYEALVGAGRSAEARAIRDRILVWDRSAGTFAGLIMHAERTGSRAEVNTLLTLAKRSLVASDYKRIARAAR